MGPSDVLKRYFGYDAFRPRQREVIDAIVKGEDVLEPSLPESFNVLVKELQSLCINVDLVKEE